MNDDFSTPVGPPEGPQLDRRLAALTRFGPRRSLTERILEQVRVPLPPWARRLRSWAVRHVTGVQGWVILVTFSLATAAFWTIAAGATVTYWPWITEAARHAADGIGWVGVANAAGFAWMWAAGLWREATAALGMPVEVVAGIYTIVALVSLAALWRLTRVPAEMRSRYVVR